MYLCSELSGLEMGLVQYQIFNVIQFIYFGAA